MLEVSGIRLSLDAALPENVEMRTKEVARALGVSERDVWQRCYDAQKRGCAQEEQRSFHHFVSRRITAITGTASS